MRFPGRRVRPVAYLMLFSFLAAPVVVGADPAPVKSKPGAPLQVKLSSENPEGESGVATIRIEVTPLIATRRIAIRCQVPDRLPVKEGAVYWVGPIPKNETKVLEIKVVVPDGSEYLILARADVVTDGKTVVAKTASLTIDLGAKEKARPNYRITGGARGPKVRQYQGTPMKSK